MRYLPQFVAGAICPLVTFGLNRSGSVLLGLILVAAIGAAGAIIRIGGSADRIDRMNLWPPAAAFCVGALISEVTGFIHYYLTYGYRDDKLNVGLTLSIIEFSAIAAIGSIAVVIATIVRRRLASTDQQ